jgi:lytic murein transglycosylase
LARALVLTTACCLAVLAGAQTPAADAAFQAWLQSLWPAAQEAGVSRATFDQAIRGLEPDLSLPDLVIPGRPETAQPGQAEFVRTPAEYLSEATLSRLAAQGRKLRDQHRSTLEGIERQFGVPGHIVLAIWGRESAFGSGSFGRNAVRVLATQAYYGRRKDFFRQELLAALKMLDDGYISLAEMRSSWGGAMGMTQFLPSEYYKYAVDFDGNGYADIWNSVPDALASAAKQLAGKGWQAGKAWAYEVRPPANLDCTIADPDFLLSVGEWLKRGFAPAYNRRLSAAEQNEQASLLMPAGSYGPAFLILKNYYVIKDYNFSDLYVLFVGNLGERILGGGGFETAWGKVVQMRTKDLEEMQQRLAALGLYRDKIDGKAGMRTRLALGAYQKTNGLRLDCWPTMAVLEHMRARAGLPR